MIPDATTLTVVIVSYNCREALAACLSSLRRQTMQTAVRVVVVDNASTDSTVDMVRAEHPGIRLLANATNEGFARACNRGLELATAGHVLMLNPDTVLPPDALQSAVDALVRRPQVGVLGCKLVQSNGEVDHASRRQIPTPWSGLRYFLKLERLRGGRPPSDAYTDPTAYEDEGPVGAVNGAFMLIRGEVARDLQGFDEAYWMYGEDLDLCVRVAEAGWQVYYWPTLEVLHIKGASSGKVRSLRVNYAFHKSMWIFYRKHQARNYGLVVSTLVGAGILAKFCFSVLRNGVRRVVRVVLPVARRGDPAEGRGRRPLEVADGDPVDR